MICMWLENKEIWCFLQFFLQRSKRTWITQEHQLGCISPDLSYHIFNLGDSINCSINERPKYDGGCTKLQSYLYWKRTIGP